MVLFCRLSLSFLATCTIKLIMISICIHLINIINNIITKGFSLVQMSFSFSFAACVKILDVQGFQTQTVQSWIKFIHKQTKLDKSNCTKSKVSRIKMWFFYETCAAAIVTARILSNASLLLSHYFFSREQLHSQWSCFPSSATFSAQVHVALSEVSIWNVKQYKRWKFKV